jgi:2-dehydro-3-deoxygluconokinase
MDVAAFGEAMLRMAPPGRQRLEQACSFDVRIGGAELNTAVAVRRLGLTSRWVSRLPDNALGRLLANEGRKLGVDMDHVIWTNEDRLGLYFVEYGAAPRPTTILYDRADSAMSRIEPGMVNWRALFEGCRHYHTSGITPALSDSAAK